MRRCFFHLCCHGAASPHLAPTPDSTQVVLAFQKSKQQPTGRGFWRSFVKQCFVSDFLVRWARGVGNSLEQRWKGHDSPESSHGQREKAHMERKVQAGSAHMVGGGLCPLHLQPPERGAGQEAAGSAFHLPSPRGCLTAKLAASASFTAEWKPEQLIVMVPFWPEMPWNLSNSVFYSQGALSKSNIPQTLLIFNPFFSNNFPLILWPTSVLFAFFPSSVSFLSPLNDLILEARFERSEVGVFHAGRAEAGPPRSVLQHLSFLPCPSGDLPKGIQNWFKWQLIHRCGVGVSKVCYFALLFTCYQHIKSECSHQKPLSIAQAANTLRWGKGGI